MDEQERSHEEELARLRQQFDQAVEGVKEMAQATATFYSELTANGVPPHDSLALTAAWLDATLGNA